MNDLKRLYEEDFPAWTAETAALLVAGRFAELDIEHLTIKTFPTVCPYTPAQVLARDFLPVQE